MKRRAKGEGSLLKIKGCRFYYAQYYDVNGKQVRVSTRTESKMEALGILRNLMADRDRGVPSVADTRKLHYGDLRGALIANYQERGNKSLETRADGAETIVGLPQLDAFFGFDAKSKGVPVSRLTTDAARAFVKKRTAEGAGAAMINRSLACLRRMLRIAHEDGKIPNVPKIRLVKEPPARKGFLEPAKFEELVQALPSYLRPLILFLYWCGVRLGEALQIEWSQVDLERRLIRLEEEQTKTAEPRVVPLPSVLVMLLKERRQKTGKVFDATNLRAEWARACVAVHLGTHVKVEGASHERNDRTKPRKVRYHWYKYTGLIVHDLRRSAVRNLINCGVPEKVAMSISGHKTRSVFDRYHIVSSDDVSNAMRQLETANGGRKAVISERLVKSGVRASRKLLVSAS